MKNIFFRLNIQMFHKNFKIREVKCFKKGEKRCEMKAGIMLHIVTSQDFQNSKSIYIWT